MMPRTRTTQRTAMLDTITPGMDPLALALPALAGLAAPVTELDRRLGERCYFRAPACSAEEGDFIAAYVQRNYRGTICYRVVPDAPPPPAGHFGRLAEPGNLVWPSAGQHAPGVVWRRGAGKRAPGESGGRSAANQAGRDRAALRPPSGREARAPAFAVAERQQARDHATLRYPCP